MPKSDKSECKLKCPEITQIITVPFSSPPVIPNGVPSQIIVYGTNLQLITRIWIQVQLQAFDLAFSLIAPKTLQIEVPALSATETSTAQLIFYTECCPPLQEEIDVVVGLV